MNIKKIIGCIALLSAPLVTHVCAVNLTVKDQGRQNCATLDPTELAGIDLNNYRAALVVNFDCEGVTTTSVNAGLFFDHDRDHFAERSAWITPDNGFLVFQEHFQIAWSKDADTQDPRIYKRKIIKNFDELKQYDENRDGVINEKDTAFNNLFVWVDKFSDGKKHNWALQPLRSMDVREVSLDYMCEPFALLDEHNNIYKVKSQMVKNDGSTLDIYHLWLQVSLAWARDDTPLIKISADVEKLPNVKGTGALMNMHNAIMLDKTGHLKQQLIAILQHLTDGDSFDSINEEMERLIALWAVAGQAIDFDKKSMDEQQRYILEVISGDPAISVDNDFSKRYQRKLSITSNYILDPLIYHSRIKDNIKYEDIKKDEATGLYHLDTTASTDRLLQQFATVPQADFLRTLKVFKKYYQFREKFRAIYGQVMRELADADPELNKLLQQEKIEIPAIPKDQPKKQRHNNYIEWSR